MNRDNVPKKKLDFKEWVQEILKLHGVNCVMLIQFEQGNVKLLGVSQDESRLNLVMNSKDRRLNYVR